MKVTSSPTLGRRQVHTKYTPTHTSTNPTPMMAYSSVHSGVHQVRSRSRMSSPSGCADGPTWCSVLAVPASVTTPCALVTSLDTSDACTEPSANRTATRSSVSSTGKSVSFTCGTAIFVRYSRACTSTTFSAAWFRTTSTDTRSRCMPNTAASARRSLNTSDGVKLLARSDVSATVKFTPTVRKTPSMSPPWTTTTSTSATVLSARMESHPMTRSRAEVATGMKCSVPTNTSPLPPLSQLGSLPSRVTTSLANATGAVEVNTLTVRGARPPSGDTVGVAKPHTATELAEHGDTVTWSDAHATQPPWPAHGWGLHDSTSVNNGHTEPPGFAARSTMRMRDRCPPPHVLEQAVHGPHSLTMQSSLITHTVSDGGAQGVFTSCPSWHCVQEK